MKLLRSHHTTNAELINAVLKEFEYITKQLVTIFCTGLVICFMDVFIWVDRLVDKRYAVVREWW